MEKLIKIQAELKCPKSQTNNFGKYKYRSCEDILEAIKPFIAKEELLLTLSDDIVQIGDRFYVKATATIRDEKNIIKEITAYAREEETKKGQDGSQITGASSSYARKYALNGMFLIDDTKDSDSTNTHNDKTESKPLVKPKETAFQKAKRLLKEQEGEAELQRQWKILEQNRPVFDEAEWVDLEKLKAELLNKFLEGEL